MIASIKKINLCFLFIFFIVSFVMGAAGLDFLGWVNKAGSILITNNTGKTISELEVVAGSGPLVTNETFYEVKTSQIVTFKALLKEADFSYTVKAIFEDGSQLKPVGNYGFSQNYSVVLTKANLSE